MTATRTETDSFGPLEVPSDKYWGAQTQRSIINFPIGWEKQPVPIIRALGVVKKACAMANKANGDMEAEIADAINEISGDIPDDINWVIRVDGHTDERAINTAQFPSNWHLSAARAISVVNYFTDQGVPADRLVAAGFGEHHPIARGDSEAAYSRNRRIELKLTSR